ncbi:hypothetical protein BKA00_002373 [Actinomadura coerulea]|uniref:Hydantoinase/oxoprolinase N-terminal domain-containing protein n=1 Tax=Actinomadura coerulea TaxID=46159 RepID=A0A7X0FXQ3_9ACTN|nr:hypothetical protein [Actinomadura coerulea]MBB6395459.1 hypothetical protein [Actinomadura coerulea]GGQ47363.1 hypothetical protein GCM10010187_76840 [Actinomadura coerulea]
MGSRLGVDAGGVFTDVLLVDERTGVSHRAKTASTRAAGLPVLFTRVRYQPGGADGGLFRRKIPALRVFEEGGPLGDFAEGAAPRPR